MRYPELELRGTKYLPEDDPRPIEPRIYENERIAMDQALDLANDALRDGNPPIAAVLIDHKRGLTLAGKTDDKTKSDLLGHAELRVYQEMQQHVGDNLRRCTLVTTAEPCTSCTPHFSEGKIGKIIFAAPRSMVWDIAGLMRPRQINFPELMIDGETKTIVVERFRAVTALGMFATYGRMRGHQLEADVDQYIRNIYEGKLEEAEIEVARLEQEAT